MFTISDQFLQDQGRLSEAVAMSFKAFDLQPDDYDVTFNLANTLRQTGNKEKAEEFYKKAALQRPEVGLVFGGLFFINVCPGLPTAIQGGWIRPMTEKYLKGKVYLKFLEHTIKLTCENSSQVASHLCSSQVKSQVNYLQVNLCHKSHNVPK